MTQIDLPYSSSVDSRTLARLFHKTTNSYKYLFFLALLNNLEAAGFTANTSISLQDLVIDMLCLAWYPHVYFKLSFGAQDQICAQLDQISIGTDEGAAGRAEGGFDVPVDGVLSPRQRDLLRQRISQRISATPLTRFVPFRLIRPFFPEIDKVADHKVNELVVDYSQRLFDERKPLYTFTTDRQKLTVHPQWLAYFRDNLPIVRGWVNWQWLQYMQDRNPSVPAVSNKLFAVLSRDSLASQTRYWRSVLQAEPVRCIYTNEIVDPGKFALDHYLPWSFVCHDQLWNLVPTMTKVNSAKSNMLPSDRYLERFIAVQHTGLTVSRKLLPEKQWNVSAEPYLLDLKLATYDELLELPLLTDAYKRVVPPLMELAKVNGFRSGWQC
jgi:hypothetical protein